MREGISSGKQNLRTTLITCLVIACFEAFHGNAGLAAAQIRIAINLMYDWMETFPMRFALGISPNPNFIEDDLAQAMCRLDMQTIHVHTRFNLQLSLRDPDATKDMPQVFDSLESAQYYLDFLSRRLADFLFSYGSYDPTKIHVPEGFDYSQYSESPPTPTEPPSPVPGENFHSHIDIHGEILRWKTAFEPLVARCRKKEDIEMMRVLQMNFVYGWYILRTFCSNVMIYDDFVGEARHIVRLAREIIEARQRDNKTKGPRYICDLGVVWILYWIGLKNRDTDVRNEVVDLLLSQHVREGLWDSIVAGKIVQWAQGIEERYAGEGIIPRWARVELIWACFNLQERTVRLCCSQQGSAEYETKIQRETTIKW